MILGSANADALELPDNKVAQVAVAGIAATNFAVRYPMRIVPGLDRVYEAVGRYTIERFARQTMRLHRGDRKYSRHDALGAASRPIPGPVARAGLNPRDLCGARHPRVAPYR